MAAPDDNPDTNFADLDPAGSSGSVTGLFSRLLQCDPVAFDTIWQRFFPRMAGLARKTLSQLPPCRIEAEDVAQSAFISFWRALDEHSEYQFGDRNDLWNLLGVITARKAQKRTRHQLAQKRGGGKTFSESELPGTDVGETSPLSQAMANLSPPEFDLFCEEMLLILDGELRTVAILRMQGYTTQEIATRLDCSSRTVQRKLEDIAALWKKIAPDD